MKLKTMKTIGTTVVLLASLFLVAWHSANAASDDVAPELEKALLSEDWPKASELLTKVDTDTPSPTLRLIKGHACLALNKNNESVRLLKDTGKTEDNQQWQGWAEAFSASNQKSAVAAYFKGDALARQQDHVGAITAFSEGLRLSPKYSLLLNARAVCYASLSKWNEAIVDLDDAAKANPKLADVHANRGTINIRRSLGAPGAKAAFSRSLEISPDFSLAKIGLASAFYGEGNWSAAEKLLGNVEVDPDIQFIADANLLLIQGNSIELLAKTGAESYAGTTIDRQTFNKEISLARGAHTESANTMQSSWVAQGIGNSMRDLGLGAKWAGKTVQAFVPKMENDNGKWRVTAVNVGAGVQSLGNDLKNAGSAVRDIAQANKSIAALRAQDSANHYRAAQSLVFQANSQGGVNTEGLRRGFFDKGAWGLLARFALQYPDPKQSTATEIEH